MSLSSNKRALVAAELIDKRLRAGIMPTSTEINAILQDPETIAMSGGPTAEPRVILSGQPLSSDTWNDLVAGVELDLAAMRSTLDDAWDELKRTAKKALDVLPVTINDAAVTEQTAIRALSLAPGNDGVSVKSNILNLSAGVGFGSLAGLDMKLSNDIEIDTTSSSLMLSRSGVKILPASTDPTHWTVSGEYTTVIEKTIGDPTWACDGNMARSWQVAVSTKSGQGRVSLSSTYSLASVSILKRIDVMAPNHDLYEVSVSVDADGSGQFTTWATAQGRGRIIVDGPLVHAKDVRVTVSKYVADSYHYSGAQTRHDYLFAISEIIMLQGAYADSGNIVTDAISLGGANIMTARLDVESSVPDTAAVNLYLAKDISGASSINDFNWVPASNRTGMASLSGINTDVTTIQSIAPAKVLSGAGQYSNSVYSIGSIDGKMTSILEGIDQFEVRAISVADFSKITFGPTGWNNTSVAGVMGRSGDELSGNNYYNLRTKIYAPSTGSHPIVLSFSNNVVQKSVTLNGMDITGRLDSGQVSVGLNPGANDLVVVIKTSSTAAATVGLADIPGCTIAIANPVIVDETSLGGSEYKACMSGSNVLVNHDPTGRIFRIKYESSTGTPADKVRVRIELVRGVAGESPTVKSAYITTGV